MFLPPGFDRSVALEAAGLVSQAYDQYKKSTDGATWSLAGDYDMLTALSAKPPGLLARREAFGFVARNRTSGTVFVTFRGTQSPEDWLSNFSFPEVAYSWAGQPAGHTEKGFTELYAQCSDDVKAAVSAAPGASVFVTGHSLGSALATLAAADLVGSGRRAGMYNFASPRVGDPAFARQFNAQVPVRWRVVNTEDIVTTVPIATPTLSGTTHLRGPLGAVLSLAQRLDYAHVGEAVSFTAHNGSIIGNHEMPTYLMALQGT